MQGFVLSFSVPAAFWFKNHKHSIFFFHIDSEDISEPQINSNSIFQRSSEQQAEFQMELSSGHWNKVLTSTMGVKWVNLSNIYHAQNLFCGNACVKMKYIYKHMCLFIHILYMCNVYLCIYTYIRRLSTLGLHVFLIFYNDVNFIMT